MENLSFADLKLNKQLVMATEEQGFTVPTPIQAKAIPAILAGHDVLGIAQTGTGKTAAYVLPILMDLKYAQGENPRALILAPTRELVMQIDDHIKSLAKYTDLRHACLFGGIGTKRQIEELEKGSDIIVSTPARFMEIYLAGYIYPKKIKYLVLDEADKMLDMGFMRQIRQVQEVIPSKRHNLLFSATFSEKIERIADEFLEFPMRIEASVQASTSGTIAQYKYAVPNFKTKLNLLRHILQDKDELNRVLIFVKSKERAENMYKYLDRVLDLDDTIKVIHGNKGQNTRTNAMEAFKEGKVRILVATDVVARGIDVTMVSHVINFDIPILYEDYVHRIGRTGRADNEGVAISFFDAAEEYHVNKIEELIKMEIPMKFIPNSVFIEPTEHEEKQVILKEIDHQKRTENPDFKGAFHDKKRVILEKKLAEQGIKINKKPKLKAYEAKKLSWNSKTNSKSKKAGGRSYKKKYSDY